MLAASFKAGWKGGAATTAAEMKSETSYQERVRCCMSRMTMSHGTGFFQTKNHCSSNISCARMPTQVAQLQLDERVQENLDRRCLIVAIHKMMQHHYEIASFQITLFPDSLT